VSPTREPRTAGERWTREELQGLRAGRFAAPAVARFLLASRLRAAEARADRPALAAQARCASVAGALAWLVLGACGPAAVRRARFTGPAWWAFVAVMLDWHLGMVETADGEPRPLGPADALTLARAWLVPVAAADPTPAVVLIGAGTDVADGIVARASEPTRLGRDLEGLVDAAFLAAVLCGALRAGLLPRAVVGLEAGRQAAGFAYAVGSYFGRAAPPDAALLHAARAITTARVTALVLAAGGRRRAGATLLAASSVAALGVLARSVARVTPAGAGRAPRAGRRSP